MIDGLYVIITNPVKSYGDIARICVDNNIKMLQLRQKHLSDKELLNICENILNITDNTNTNLVIDDRVDLALVSGCDGVHVGQDDMPYKMAREILPDKIIGLSTHSLKQVEKAMELKPDYIGFGPIYKTPTKKIPDPEVGTELLKKALKVCHIPLVAIGGIDNENINEVLNAGARNICMVRYLMAHEDLDKRIKYIQKLLKEKK